MASRHSAQGGRWDQLDALVDEVVDHVLAHRPEPFLQPDVEEAMFLDRASEFLMAHGDAERVLATLHQRVSSRAPQQEEVRPAVEPDAEEPDDMGREAGEGEESVS